MIGYYLRLMHFFRLSVYIKHSNIILMVWTISINSDAERSTANDLECVSYDKTKL